MFLLFYSCVQESFVKITRKDGYVVICDVGAFLSARLPLPPPQPRLCSILYPVAPTLHRVAAVSGLAWVHARITQRCVSFSHNLQIFTIVRIYQKYDNKNTKILSHGPVQKR